MKLDDTKKKDTENKVLLALLFIMTLGYSLLKADPFNIKIREGKKKLDDNEGFIRFANLYSICPICKKRNSREILKDIFLDNSERVKNIKKDLLSLMEQSNDPKKNINSGIPCCECLKLVTEEES